MIKSFKSKALAELFKTGKTAKIAPKMHDRALVRLDVLNEAARLDELRMPATIFMRYTASIRPGTRSM